MDKKLIIIATSIFALGILVGYAITSILLIPQVGLHTITGYLVGKGYPCNGDVCPTLIVYSVESDVGRTYYLTKDGVYCSTLEFDSLIFQEEDHVEVTGIVYTKTVNQGLIYCLEWFSVTVK